MVPFTAYYSKLFKKLGIESGDIRGTDDLALLHEAAREAGAIAMRYFGKSPEVWMKGGTSPVSEADYAADKYLRETLLEARPDHGWLSEETTDDPVRLVIRKRSEQHGVRHTEDRG